MKFIYKTRTIEVEGYLEFNEGYYVESAWFVDSEGEYLSPEECSEVETIFQSELYQNAYEDMASAAYDRAKDFAKYGDL